MKDLTDYLEKDDVHTILDVARGYRERDYLMLALLWQTGARVSEMLALAPSNIEFNNRAINLKVTKGNRPRRVYISQQTADELKEYIAKNQR